MPLVLTQLVSQLENGWLVPRGGSFPASSLESGDRFAGAISSWFSAAQANGVPCATATARRPQLAAQAAQALATGTAAGAGNALAQALAAYLTGQAFGPGVAAAPLGTPAAVTALSAVFQDLNSPHPVRAQQIATACDQLARTVLVTFPATPPVVAPVT